MKSIKSTLLVVSFLLLSVLAHAQKIAIMGALDQEIALLLEQMERPKKQTKGNIDFYTGKLQGKKVVVLKAGVGKVNASYATAILADNFKPSALIFTGVAGGLHPDSQPGDLVIGEKLFQYDFGRFDSVGFKVTPYRKLRGGNLEELYVNADQKLLQKSIQASAQVTFEPVADRTPQVFQGVIATGDMFVSNNEKASWLFESYGALATEMEGAAVAHLCQTLQIPFVVIRSCSDNANNQAHVNFQQFVGPASINSARLVMKILENL